MNREEVVGWLAQIKDRYINGGDEYYDDCRKQAIDMAIEALKQPERKKGSWDYGTQCSVCKGTIIPPKDRKVHVNFCPWCGADMRDSYG